MLDSQGSTPDYRCGKGVKHENLLGQDLDPGHGWKYRHLCNVPPLIIIQEYIFLDEASYKLRYD